MEGWIKMHRKIIDSELWYKPGAWMKVWLYIVMNVSHKEISFLKIGEGLFKYDKIAESCQVSYHQVRSAINWLISTHSLSTRKTTRGIFIKVLNYTKYQIDQGTRPTQKSNLDPNRTQTGPTLYNKNGRMKEIEKKNKIFIKGRKDELGRCEYCKSMFNHPRWCQLYISKS